MRKLRKAFEEMHRLWPAWRGYARGRFGLPFIAFAGAFLSAIWQISSADERDLCHDIRYLVDQSETGFAGILGENGGRFGGYQTTHPLPGALYCVILDDITKRAYQCAWEFAYQDAAAQETYERYLGEIRTCLGDIAREKDGQPVNHPDYYAATYFDLPGGQVSVTLKNKSALAATFVSVGIDGFKH